MATTTTTHTPGPWSVIERTDTIDGEPVIYVGQPDRREAMGDYRLDYAEHDVARVFTREDARLIAHAPAMLDVLRVLANDAMVEHALPGTVNKARDILRAVEG